LKCTCHCGLSVLLIQENQAAPTEAYDILFMWSQGAG
jgi:hypothetical protein